MSHQFISLLPPFNSQLSLANFTLILPTVSVGNVGQLACDLLINTLLHGRGQSKHHMQLVGQCVSHTLMPLAGADPFTPNGKQLATSMQVFACLDAKIAIIQQRTPPYKELRHKFLDSFASWIKEQHFSRVLILTSSFLEFAYFPNELSRGEKFPLRYHVLSTQSGEGTSHEKQLSDWLDKLKQVGVDKLEEMNSLDEDKLVDGVNNGQSNGQSKEAKSELSGPLPLPGSGSAIKLMKKLLLKEEKTANSTDSSLSSIPCLSLILFCSEGENTPHARVMADYVNALLGLVCVGEEKKKSVSGKGDDGKNETQVPSSSTVAWIDPFSWRDMFGLDKPPATLYG